MTKLSIYIIIVLAVSFFYSVGMALAQYILLASAIM